MTSDRMMPTSVSSVRIAKKRVRLKNSASPNPLLTRGLFGLGDRSFFCSAFVGRHGNCGVRSGNLHSNFFF